LGDFVETGDPRASSGESLRGIFNSLMTVVHLSLFGPAREAKMIKKPLHPQRVRANRSSRT